jgi:PAS domain S-box-containing protein
MSGDLGYVTVAATRAKELPTRLVAAAMIGCCAYAVSPSPLILAWLLAVALTQGGDHWLLEPLRRRPDRAVSSAMRVACVASALVNAVVYSSAALFFWFASSQMDKAIALLFLASGLLHVMLLMHHARAVFVATAVPYAVQFVGLPLLAALSSREVAATLGVEAAVLLFFAHLYVSVRRVSHASKALRQATVEAEEREASFRLLFERNPVAMWLVDLKATTIDDVNEAAVRLFGWSREEMRGRSFFEMIHEDDRALAIERHAAGALQAARGLRDWRLCRADGAMLMVRAFTDVIHSGDGGAVVCALVDVTERARAQALLEQARDAAEAANRSKSVFLANMSHEIRTPLNGVVAVAELLGRSRLARSQREMVELIRSSGATLERLLSGILDLARIESGHVEIKSEPFVVGTVLRDVIALSGLRAQEKGVGMVLDLPDDAERRVLGDSVRLGQILTNLVNNAVKFTEAGEVRVSVSRSAEGAWRFEVRDTGVGFDSASKESIFGRFQQADGSITRRFGGTGLGLAISRQLAGLMDGTLECDSRPGEGSSFVLALPLADATAASTAIEVAAAAGDGVQSLEGLRVLLADDHPTNRRVVELILQPSGVFLVSVENGAEAVAAMAAGAFDVVLMDMQMPVMDGLAATRAIRAREREGGAVHVPVLMLTANGMPEHLEAAAQAGADGYLTKPVSPLALLEAIAGLAAAAPCAKHASAGREAA